MSGGHTFLSPAIGPVCCDLPDGWRSALVSQVRPRLGFLSALTKGREGPSTAPKLRKQKPLRLPPAFFTFSPARSSLVFLNLHHPVRCFWRHSRAASDELSGLFQVSKQWSAALSTPKRDWRILSHCELGGAGSVPHPASRQQRKAPRQPNNRSWSPPNLQFASPSPATRHTDTYTPISSILSSLLLGCDYQHPLACRFPPLNHPTDPMFSKGVIDTIMVVKAVPERLDGTRNFRQLFGAG